MSIRRQNGASLIELVIFIVIVSVGLSGMLATLSTTVRHSADPMIQAQLLVIAESMMDEIQARDFAPPALGFTPSSKACTSFRTERASYDDIADYDGITDCPIYSLADNAPVPGLTAYSVSVSVAGASGLNDLAASVAKKIVVTTRQGNESLVLEAWRTDYGS